MAFPEMGSGDLSEVTALLERVARMIDQMSDDAQLEPVRDDRVVELGDASHGVHRALVALGACATDRR
jgi:erythromycin esterase-like protein